MFRGLLALEVGSSDFDFRLLCELKSGETVKFGLQRPDCELGV